MWPCCGAGGAGGLPAACGASTSRAVRWFRAVLCGSPGWSARCRGFCVCAFCASWGTMCRKREPTQHAKVQDRSLKPRTTCNQTFTELLFSLLQYYSQTPCVDVSCHGQLPGGSAPGNGVTPINQGRIAAALVAAIIMVTEGVPKRNAEAACWCAGSQPLLCAQRPYYAT